MLVAGCTNETVYTYPWGSLYASRDARPLGMGWWFWLAQHDADHPLWPQIYIALSGKRVLLERVQGVELERAGFVGGPPIDDHAVYARGGSMFVVEHGQAVEWRYNATGDDKEGPRYYPSATGSAGFQFPLRTGEVEDLFGPPRREHAHFSMMH